MAKRSGKHQPSFASFPATGERWRLSGWAIALLAFVLVPVAALTQERTLSEAAQRLRVRDLKILEDTLSETIQEAIQQKVREINATNQRAQQEAAEQAGDTPEIRFVFRATGETHARGMFLEDYGVIFTVQVPTLSYNQAAMYIGMAGPDEFAIVIPGAPDMLYASQLAREVQARGQMNRLRAEIDDFTTRLNREIDASGTASVTAQKVQVSLNQLETAYREYSGEVERLRQERENRGTETAEQEAQDETRAEDRRDRPVLRGRGPRLTFLAATDPEALARAEAIANDQRTELESAVIEATVDALASYGSVIHGLEATDRLAVVLLPSTYLDRLRSWLPATRRAEEFIISVRYGDIRSFEDRLITSEEFGNRIRVESRLGQPARDER